MEFRPNGHMKFLIMTKMGKNHGFARISALRRRVEKVVEQGIRNQVID